MISEGTADKEERREQERVSFDYPLHVHDRGVQVRLQRGQRHVHNCAVDERHAGSESCGGKHPGAGRFCTRRCSCPRADYALVTRFLDECRHDGGLSSPSHLLICTALSSIFHEGIVGITVQPTLAGLRGSDDWMPGGVRVFAGVPIWRAVTAERDTTCLAGPQMNPVCANLHAFFTLAARSVFDRRNRVEMRAASVRHRSKSLFRVPSTRNAVDEFEWFHHRGHGGHRDKQREFTG